jgi:multiple sugar transport system ATP-binding protein
LHAPIIKSQHDQIRPLLGKKACLGLRPRAFVMKDKATPEQQQIVFKGEIEVSEMLGEEVLAHIVAGGHRFIISLDPHVMAKVDGGVEVCPVMERAHVFDAETEQNLTLPEGIKPGGDVF